MPLLFSPTAMLEIQALTVADRDWVRRKTIENWGAEIVVAHGEVVRPDGLSGFKARHAGEDAGLLTYVIRADACEIVTLNAWQQGLGIGTALLEAVRMAAGRAGCRRLWLVTTNDNSTALRFYQRRGFSICAVRIGALAASRRLKPEIPLTGEDGIPIRDEIELETWL